MYLKKLELVGFKSFADRTEFVFGSGMTAVVGPNGCGKSNVVDAFKWIFGEQSAKGLRGGEMKDVIFNGTQTRKASGYGEVTAVFDNSDRFFDIDFSEVAITRRLFRSGESEYLINRQKSRLRDIKNLLMDTGIGSTSYSIFEQGKIDVLLQASSLDRRIIFEEAAGISRYRARKAESLRALQRVEDNLSRVGDVIAELERQRQRVRIQAGRARKFREYSDRLREHRIRLAIDDFRSLVTERAEVTSERFLLDFQIDRLEETCTRLRSGLERHSRKRAVTHRTLKDVRGGLTEVRTRRERTEESIAHNRRRIEELRTERERRQGDLETTDRAVVETRLEFERETQEHGRAVEEVEERRRTLGETTRNLEILRREHDELREREELIRRDLVHRIDEKTRLSNAQVQLDSEIASLEGRRQRLENEIQGTRQELREIESARGELDGELARTREECGKVDQQKAEALETLSRLESELVAVGEILAEVNDEAQRVRSRLETLQSFEENLDGVTRGVASILRKRREDAADSREVHGLLAHLIEVESEFALAVEAALGSRAQALVVETQEGALELLREARASRAGAVEAITLERVHPLAEDEIPPGEDVIGVLRQKVSAPPVYGDLLDRLLGRVILVRDLATALALSRNGLRDYRLATLSGELIEPLGSLSITGDATTGLISRRSEMQDLERKLRDLQEELEKLQGVRDSMGAARAERESRLAAIGEERESLSLGTASLESQLDQLERDQDRLSRVVRVGESELSEILGEFETCRGERDELARRLLEVDLQRKALAAESAEIEERVRTHGEEIQKFAEGLTEARVGLARSEKREEGLGKSLQQLARSLEERERREGTLNEEIADLLRRIESTDRELGSAETSLEEIRQEETRRAEELQRAEQQDEELAGIEEGFRQELERLRNCVTEKASIREKINLRDQEGVLRRNAILEKVSEDYDVDLLALIEKSGGTETASSEPPSSSDSEESGLSLHESILRWLRGEESGWDSAAAAAEARSLQEKIRRLGNVNLEALDELEEIEERLGFQVSQRDDLLEAERDLRRIIAEINKTSRELFSTTFAEVQKNFDEIFKKCFSGGKAELILEDGADILESGIEIVARPPGKKLTSLTLMSGGEKTMTTIALMFSIFRARPSPFCLLDEVDAPLDESNVQRFVLLLRDFLSQSQFIIITHNKVTMSVADCLYGVTMQEKGVSKRVAVQIDSYDPENPHASLSTADIDAAPLVEVPGAAPQED